MLIVGGAAALTAITAYLSWYFLRQWRLGARQRKAHRPIFAENRPMVHRAHTARELDPVP